MLNEMKNRIVKNCFELAREWQGFAEDQLYNLKRLLRPSLNPGNREHFVPHVLVAFISTFYGLRRTLTYLTVAWLLWKLLS